MRAARLLSLLLLLVPAGCSESDPVITARNECADGSHRCSLHAICQDTPLAYTCRCDTGWTGDGRSCRDVDECATNNGNCGPGSVCTNQQGAPPTCECAPGFSATPDGACVEVRACIALQCGENSICSTNGAGEPTCACASGFTGDGLRCTDVNECGTQSSPCGENSTCRNTVGDFVCGCQDGYERDSADPDNCVDIDECAVGGCDANATCTNTPGSFACSCLSGYAGDGYVCEEIDECNFGIDTCDENADCTNTPGDFTCTCRAGFSGDGFACEDINECDSANGGCNVNASCTNIPGSRTCECQAPTFFGDGLVCTPIQYLKPATISPGAAFGSALSATRSGPFALLTVGANNDQPAVTFTKDTGTGLWGAASAVSIEPGSGNDFLRVAMSGDTLVIGDPRADGVGGVLEGGAQHFLRWSAGNADWEFIRTFRSPGSWGSRRGGHAVATDGQQFMFGVPGREGPDTTRFAAIFDVEGRITWATTTLETRYSEGGDVVLANSGFRIVGDPERERFFTYNGSSEIGSTQVPAGHAADSDFAASLSLWEGEDVATERYLAVGAPGASKVFLFGFRRGTWTLSQTLTSSSGGSNQFGEDLSFAGRIVDGETTELVLVVGAPNNDEGTAEIYRVDPEDGRATRVHELRAPHGQTNDRFGSAVTALTLPAGFDVFVSARHEDSGDGLDPADNTALDSGAVFGFFLPTAAP